MDIFLYFFFIVSWTIYDGLYFVNNQQTFVSTNFADIVAKNVYASLS